MELFLDNVTRDFPQAALLEDYGIVHYHMLCDGGIPLKTYMQKPFNHVEAATSLKKLHFNNCFSSAHRVVESAFGILVSRFRLFTRPLSGTAHHCALQIVAAIILHNLLLSKSSASEVAARFPPLENDLEPVSMGSRIRMSEANEAREERLRLTEYFARRDRLQL